METLAQALRNIGPMRLVVVGGVVLGLLVFFAVFITRLTSPTTELLYGALDAGDSARIAGQLQIMGVKYEMRQNGTEIYVGGQDISRVRLALADQGLPGHGLVGYEIFDESEGLGTTKFIQDVNLLRALEGELAKTIQGLSPVKSARVHLVLPKRELFSRQRQEPSASIVLTMKGAVRLNAEQVAAVQHVIAAAIPGLLPRRISIIDNKGKLLAAGFDETDPAQAIITKAEEKQRALESRLARTIEELLEKSVGFGKVRAEVHAEMDFDRISTQEESFDPDGQVVRSTQSIEQTSSARDAEGTPAVTVGTNLPDANVEGGETQSSTSADSRVEETVNFEISKKVTNHVREAGNVRKLSVAVLIDYKRVENEDGDFVFEPRTEDELQLLEGLVRNTVGFNGDRGDSIEIVNLQFAEFEEEEELELFFGFGKNDLIKFSEVLVLGIVALLVILLVVRPLISKAFETLPSAAQAASERLLADQTGAAPALAGPAAPGVPAPAEAAEEEQFEELIDIDRVEGRVKASSVKKVGEIVDKHPDEALSIIRAWMYQEA